MYVFTLCVCLLYSKLVYATFQQHGFCEDSIYVEIGKPGVVSCAFREFRILGWILGEDDVETARPFIYLENSLKYGQGHRNGDYDIYPNGSLIINHVSLEHERSYTSLFVYANGTSRYTHVAVNVYERPVSDFPVLNGLTIEQHVPVRVNSDVIFNCAVNRIRPKVQLEWLYPPEVIELQNLTYSIDYGNGTYGVFLNSKFKVISSDVDNVAMYCKIVGPMAWLFTSYDMIPLRLRIDNTTTKNDVNELTTEGTPNEENTDRTFSCNTVCRVSRAETYVIISLFLLSLVL